MKLKIVWSYDEYDCEDCGSSDSIGAYVTLDNVVIMDRPARAHCFDSEYVTEEEIYKAALKHLGVEIEENRGY